MTEPCPISRWAHQLPAQLAIVGSHTHIDYATLDCHLCSVQQQLAEQGMQRGMRLAACVRDSLEGVLLAWSCVRSGILFCPLNPAFPLEQQQALANQLRVDGFWSPQTPPVGNWRSICLDFAALSPSSHDGTLDPDQPNNLVLTSGSSGHPKAVMHTLANHLASARGSATLLPLDHDCGWLLSLPLFHVGGYAILFRVFLAGATLILDERNIPLKERLEQQPITHLSLVPTQLWRLLAQGFDPRRCHLREVLLGGAAIAEPLVEQMTALGLTPKVSYGLSEMGSQVCTAIPAQPGLVGKPLPGREVKIENGEICVRGDTLFLGYDAAHGIEPARDADGWFHTRDKGWLTEQGELIVEGRLDNLFISGGENIQPEAIEQQLVNHPAVAQALVVPVCDEEWGARPACFIDWLAEPCPYAELEAWLRQRLPGFMVPDCWLAWPAQGGALKPSRRLWQQQAEAHCKHGVTNQTDD